MVPKGKITAPKAHHFSVAIPRFEPRNCPPLRPSVASKSVVRRLKEGAVGVGREGWVAGGSHQAL